MTEPVSAEELLAEYFTGPCVGIHSIGLQMSGMSRVAADAFFKVRTSLGIAGYATKDEALRALANQENK